MTDLEILEFIRTALRVKKLNIDDKMGEVHGWDSLGQVDLIIKIEKQFKVCIPNDRIGELTSVRMIIGFINEVAKQ